LFFANTRGSHSDTGATSGINSLYTNDGTGHFTRQATSAVEVGSTFDSFAGAFVDYDGDDE
jgi:hypothetical protein